MKPSPRIQTPQSPRPRAFELRIRSWRCVSSSAVRKRSEMNRFQTVHQKSIWEAHASPNVWCSLFLSILAARTPGRPVAHSPAARTCASRHSVMMNKRYPMKGMIMPNNNRSPMDSSLKRRNTTPSRTNADRLRASLIVLAAVVGVIMLSGCASTSGEGSRPREYNINTGYPAVGGYWGFGGHQ